MHGSNVFTFTNQNIPLAVTSLLRRSKLQLHDISYFIEQIKELKKIRNQKNLDFDIEIDGGINFNNNKLAIEAGANILVSGTTIFKNNNGDIKKNIDLLKSS